MRSKLWDAKTGFFYPYDLRNERRIQIRTSSGLLPMFAGVCDQVQSNSLVKQMTMSFAPNEQWRLCASTAFEEPAFDAMKYWRGPIWINVNWMLFHGLRRYGFADVAERIKRDTLNLYHDVGPFEYFDPRPVSEAGASLGLGADLFSWSAALAIDMLDNVAVL
jgi:neutral trehalase